VETQGLKRREPHVAFVARDGTAAAQRKRTHDLPRAHAPAAPGPSLLRLSASTRLLVVAIIAVLLWTAVYWALR
jgi:hypothetical protein